MRTLQRCTSGPKWSRSANWLGLLGASNIRIPTPKASANLSAKTRLNWPLLSNSPTRHALSRASTTNCKAPASSHRLPCAINDSTATAVNWPPCFLPSSNCTSRPLSRAMRTTFAGANGRVVKPSPHSTRETPRSAQRSKYAGSWHCATAISNGPPPVTVGTPAFRAALIFLRVDSSFAISQHAIEIFRIDMNWQLCSKWLSRVVGSYPGSNGLVRAGSSFTPIRRRKLLESNLPLRLMAFVILIYLHLNPQPPLTAAILRIDQPYLSCSQSR